MDRKEIFRIEAPCILGRANDIVEQLDKMNYFLEPASSKYHGCYEGALFDHSLDVSDNLWMLTRLHKLKWQRETSPGVIGFLHDLCKVGAHNPIYKEGTEEFDHYEYNQVEMPDHGARSLALCTQFDIKLTEEEMYCIRWHMGAFDKEENWKYYTAAIHKYPNVLWTHTADMMSAHINNI